MHLQIGFCIRRIRQRIQQNSSPSYPLLTQLDWAKGAWQRRWLSTAALAGGSANAPLMIANRPTERPRSKRGAIGALKFLQEQKMLALSVQAITAALQRIAEKSPDQPSDAVINALLARELIHRVGKCFEPTQFGRSYFRHAYTVRPAW